jgi:hypothetical protein
VGIPGAYMSPRPSRFTQAEVTRAISSVIKAGLRVGRVEIATDGKIVVVASELNERQSKPNEWNDIE